MDPCWLNADAPVVCSQNGIGCPLPHDGTLVSPMPPEFTLSSPLCPVHGAASCHGKVCECPHCPPGERRRQRWGLTGWTRTRRKIRKAKRRAWRRWRSEVTP